MAKTKFADKFKTVFWQWLPFLVVTTVMSALVYGAVQQNYRQSANDPQIRLVEDISHDLDNGAQPTTEAQSFLGAAKTDLNGLAPFVIIYDQSRSTLYSSVIFNGQTPIVPAGLFDRANREGQVMFTWQPGGRSSRVAAVLQHNTTGYVLAGRNLAVVEWREDKLMVMTFLAWLVAAAGSLVACWLAEIK